MTTVWKVMLGLALVLPVTAYALGSLTGATVESPVERAPVVVEDPPPSEPGGLRPVPGPSDTPHRNDPPPRVNDDPVTVVSPPPTRVGDDDDDDRHEDGDDDDDKGPASDDDDEDDGDDGDDD